MTGGGFYGLGLSLDVVVDVAVFVAVVVDFGISRSLLKIDLRLSVSRSHGS